MSDSEDDSRYPKKFLSLNRPKHPMYSRPIPKRHAYYQEEEDDDEEEQEDDELDGYPHQNDEDEYKPQGGYNRNFSSKEELERIQKRQKQNKQVSGYELAGTSDTKAAYEWKEQEAFVLLEIWGDRFLQLNRRSLRNEDWIEIAEKVSEEIMSERSETQCRRMMNNLKMKYKKEKTKVEKSRLGSSKWVFYNKLDMLLSSSPKSDSNLACGVDSGEFVFMNTRVYLDKSNGFDEMMDSPGESEEEDEDDERMIKMNDSASYLLLADSVKRFGKVYEKIEKSKKDHMKELEKMRADFQRDLELQKKQILDKAQSEISKIREGVENGNGNGNGNDDDDEDDDDDESDDDDDEMENESAANLSDE